MVTLLPQIDNLLNVASAAFSAAPLVVNWTNEHPVLRRLKVRHRLGSLQDLLCHRIVDTIISVLHVLLRQWIIRIGWFFMPIWTFLPSLTLSLLPERANMSSVPL